MSDEIKESPSGSFHSQAWTKRKHPSGNETYRHDETGIELPGRQFYGLVRTYKSQGYVPTEAIIDAAGGTNTIPQHAASIRIVEVAPTDDEQEDKETTATPPPAASRPPIKDTTRPIPGVSAAQASRTAGTNYTPSPPVTPPLSGQQHVRETIAHLPEPEPHPARRSDSRATPKELVSSFQITLAIVTGIVALLLQFPEVRMSDFETMAIAIPAANLFAASSLNERFGKMLATSGDWQLLGYALWTYGSRVWSATQMRTQSARQQQQYYAPTPVAAPPTPAPSPQPQSNGSYAAGYTGTAQQVNLPFAKGAQGARDLRGLSGA